MEVRDYQNEAQGENCSLNNLERRAFEYLVSDEFLGKWGGQFRSMEKLLMAPESWFSKQR